MDNLIFSCYKLLQILANVITGDDDDSKLLDNLIFSCYKLLQILANVITLGLLEFKSECFIGDIFHTIVSVGRSFSMVRYKWRGFPHNFYQYKNNTTIVPIFVYNIVIARTDVIVV